jgi:hypothetical protein
MVARMTFGGWIISHSCSWITVYVLCCNDQVNLIMILMTCTCICLHSLFFQLPNCNLFTQHVIYLYGETHLVNCGPRSILLHSYCRLILQALFTFSQTNIFYHTIRLILCLQQTSELSPSQLASTFGSWFFLLLV